jgi:thiaminase (transcriptional activator TenA)
MRTAADRQNLIRVMPAKGGDMAVQLTDRLWGSIRGTFDSILAHPFIAGLSDGSLSADSFEFYIVQDALYLTDYARTLSVCAARAPHERATQMFCQHAAGAIDVEREMHRGFFADLGLSEKEVRRTEMAPTNLAYTSYLQATAYAGTFAEALGAVLPCYWIYWEVGKALIKRGSPNDLYSRWIDTYGGEPFADIVQAVLALTDEVGDGLSSGEASNVEKRFRTTARFEWMFWDMGYRQEAWLV